MDQKMILWLLRPVQRKGYQSYSHWLITAQHPVSQLGIDIFVSQQCATTENLSGGSENDVRSLLNLK